MVLQKLLVAFVGGAAIFSSGVPKGAYASAVANSQPAPAPPAPALADQIEDEDLEPGERCLFCCVWDGWVRPHGIPSVWSCERCREETEFAIGERAQWVGNLWDDLDEWLASEIVDGQDDVQYGVEIDWSPYSISCDPRELEKLAQEPEAEPETEEQLEGFGLRLDFLFSLDLNDFIPAVPPLLLILAEASLSEAVFCVALQSAVVALRLLLGSSTISFSIEQSEAFRPPRAFWGDPRAPNRDTRLAPLAPDAFHAPHPPT